VRPDEVGLEIVGLEADGRGEGLEGLVQQQQLRKRPAALAVIGRDLGACLIASSKLRAAAENSRFC